MIRILLVTIVVISCKGTRTEGETKYITVAHTDTERFINGKNVLIKRVHEKHWDVFYRFDKDCPANRKTEQNYQTLRRKLEEGIRIWLEPLREITNKTIVDKFVFYKSKEDNYRLPDNGQQIEYEITAIFFCKTGRSGADREQRRIKMREKEVSRNSAVFDNLPYSDITLLHELGHTFDLADTYVGNRSFSPPSSGTYLRTIGNQPKSVMSGNYCSLQGGLCLDDKRAIQWLYRYHYEGLDPTDCPPEFVYEELTHTTDNYTNRVVGGCVYKQPLLIELRQKHLDRSKSLLANDENLKINDKDKYGYSALHYLALLHLDFGRSIGSLLLKLLDYPGIDVNITDNYGNTPLHWAAWFGNIRMVADLLFISVGNETKFIQPNAKNKYGETALHHAAKLGREVCVRDILLKRTDIDANITEHRAGNTPLHEAAKNGHTEIVKALLAHNGINRNIRNRAGKTAEQLAELNGYEETVKAFD